MNLNQKHWVTIIHLKYIFIRQYFNIKNFGHFANFTQTTT